MRLEEILHPELHRPAADPRGDEAEIRQRGIRDRVSQPRPVEHVERLDTDLEALRPQRREPFAKRHVQGPESRLPQRVLLLRRRERAGCRRAERVAVKPRGS